MDLQYFAAEYGVRNIRIFAPMSRLQYVGLIPGIAFRTSSTPEEVVECEIDETRYRVEDGYKITLRAVDEAYGNHHYYQSDLESIIRDNPDLFRIYIVNIDGYQRIPNQWFDWRKK